MTRSIMRVVAGALAIAILAGNGVIRVGADPVTFEFADPIDLGSNLDRIGSLQWSHILGTEWDTNFQLGGIIGSQKATVIPAIPPFLNNAIVADTRTGLRMSGRAAGSTGLEFFANFNASGLDAGAAFDFQPKIVDLPSQVSQGEFTRLETIPGMVYNSAFTESLDLPSFDADMNFFFNLDLDTRIDYGLFPIVPYGSVPFRPDPIHIDQSLLKFAFDLDPNSRVAVIHSVAVRGIASCRPGCTDFPSSFLYAVAGTWPTSSHVPRPSVAPPGT